MLRLAILLNFVAYIVSQCTNSSIKLNGAGASTPAAFFRSASQLYQITRAKYARNVSTTYVSVNSGFGKQRIINDEQFQPIHFAASESLLTTDDERKHPSLVTFPVIAGAVAVLYNLPGINNLTLSVDSIVRIYMGKIRVWNDPWIAADNPTLQLPAANILPVARSDSNGETTVFTQTLATANSDWAVKYGVFSTPNFVNNTCCESLSWRDANIQHYASFPCGMVTHMLATPFAIGYASLPNIVESVVSVANVRNLKGTVTKPDIEGVQAAIDYSLFAIKNSSRARMSLTFDLTNANHTSAFPFVFFSYLIINITTTSTITCCEMVELTGFIDWLLNSQPSAVIAYGLVTLTPDLIQLIISSILKNVSCSGKLVYLEYLASMQEDSSTSLVIIVTATVCCGLIFIGFLTLVVYCQFRGTEDEAQWLISYGRVQFNASDSNDTTVVDIQSIKSSRKSVATSFSDYGCDLKYIMERGRLDLDIPIFLASLPFKRNPKQWSQTMKRQLLNLKKTIFHENLLGICGVTISTIETQCLSIGVYQYATKGTLHYVLKHCHYDISDVLQYHLSAGAASGMAFLHRHSIVHGFLSSLTCYMDASWTLKIANWDLSTMLALENPINIFQRIGDWASFEADPTVDDETLIRWLYVDPRSVLGIFDEKVDVFSFGLLLAEIFTRQIPYTTDVNADNTFSKIVNGKRSLHGKVIPPTLSRVCVPEKVRKLIFQCMGNVEARPSFKTLQCALKQGVVSSKGIVDVLLDIMERYTNSLEDKISEKTAAYEALLFEVLPRPIAIKLLHKECIIPQSHENVTVFFSDIVGFTQLCQILEPVEVFDVLNRLYSAFDLAASTTGVLKIETIGDGYMACSGLTVENNQQNSIRDMAIFALSILKIVGRFELGCERCLLRPQNLLAVRIGINSGHVTTGVVGSKVPHFCVFGDTVNTASRMESSSEPMRIQLSHVSAMLLITSCPGEFIVQRRGNVDIKGKGRMETFWLNEQIELKDSLNNRTIAEQS